VSEIWVRAGNAFAKRIELQCSIEVVPIRLSEKLLELRMTPPNSDAASICIMISPSDLTLTAGKGTRFELDPLPDSEEEVLQLVQSIVKGTLSEQFGPRGIKFRLVVEQQSVLTGRSSFGLQRRTKKSTAIRYAPYDPHVR
jgi:hypothetical protein